jgi:hypothetical protein
VVGGRALCTEVSINSYGVLTCLTNANVIKDGASLDFSLDGVSLRSYVASSCTFAQSELITVTSATLDGDSITFIGTGFGDYYGFAKYATFGGIDASIVTIVSATEIVATWGTTGVAAVSGVPVLWIE